MTAETAAELHTIIDLIRYGTSRFNEAGLTFGHSYDNALDEATQLVLHSLHLPHDLGPAYGQARLLQAEKLRVLELFQRRIDERIPAAYLTGEAWFAGLSFKSDARAGAALADRRTDRMRLRAVAGRPRCQPCAGPLHRFGLHRHRHGPLLPELGSGRRRPE